MYLSLLVNDEPFVVQGWNGSGETNGNHKHGIP